MYNNQKFYVVQEENPANCNGGDYPAFYVVDGHGHIHYYGRRCACWGGCSNTTRKSDLYRTFGEGLTFLPANDELFAIVHRAARAMDAVHNALAQSGALLPDWAKNQISDSEPILAE